jgi:hypothetical protein
MMSRKLLCPSAQPGMPGAEIHGVMDATTGCIQPLDRPERLTDALVALTAPLLPTEVLRISATCQESSCGHFTGSICSLGQRLVQITPAAAFGLPRCAIRADCRWFNEQGREICVRCNMIITDGFFRSETMTLLSQPQRTIHPNMSF